MMYKLVLLRHGQSTWNKENKFTGWYDVGLSEKGVAEATSAGKLLKAEGFEFDMAYTSVLRRAIKTLWICLSELEQEWIPVERSWRLNERHYGDLTGLDKAETAEKFGDDQVFIWRRSYDIPPPPMDENDKRHPKHDPKYKDVPQNLLPGSESLKLTKERVLPFWESDIAPKIKEGKKLIVAAHGNSLRALVKHLDNVSEEEITKLNIPTAIPLVYELDQDLKPIKSYYLGDQEAAKKAAEAVASQAQRP